LSVGPSHPAGFQTWSDRDEHWWLSSPAAPAEEKKGGLERETRENLGFILRSLIWNHQNISKLAYLRPFFGLSSVFLPRFTTWHQKFRSLPTLPPFLRHLTGPLQVTGANAGVDETVEDHHIAPGGDGHISPILCVYII
jgi:hypothetical protein